MEATVDSIIGSAAISTRNKDETSYLFFDSLNFLPTKAQLKLGPTVILIAYFSIELGQINGFRINEIGSIKCSIDAE